jgi:hypothetical protein
VGDWEIDKPLGRCCETGRKIESGQQYCPRLRQVLTVSPAWDKQFLCGVVFLVAVILVPACGFDLQSGRYFVIEILDDKTGRGVALVELKTVNNIRYYTDSSGAAAFYEPGLMNRGVFFHISSHGYEFDADGFGYHGRTLLTTPGGVARLRIRRKNIAERLYRITGQGIYRDTLLAGRKAPIKQPLLNGRVLGQDTVMASPYRGKIYWFWGDTNRESYPLGNFATSGATSELPGKGGLDPSVGIDLTYFVDEQGFSKKMVPLPGEGMIWIDAVLTVNDEPGCERLVAHYARMASLGKKLEHGLVVFNDRRQVFEQLVKFDLSTPLAHGGRPLSVVVGGQRYYYFADPYPFVRIKAEWQHLIDPTVYEAWTCLVPGSAYDKESPALDRRSGGQLIWAWKKNTAPINVARQRELIAGGKIKSTEAWINLRDAETGDTVHAHGGSVHWNDFRGKYVMILLQVHGTSHLGEIWYAEAAAPEGPWLWAVKIVTHDRYTFYNPTQHPFFDQDGGRVIYFEGTYTNMFSATDVPTPRYNYNQIMYRLDLSEPRLALPKSKVVSRRNGKL